MKANCAGLGGGVGPLSLVDRWSGVETFWELLACTSLLRLIFLLVHFLEPLPLWGLFLLVIVNSYPLCPLPITLNLSDPCFPLSAVTVADYANSDPAVVKSGRVKKAVANAVQQEGESALGPQPSLHCLRVLLCMTWETPLP